MYVPTLRRRVLGEAIVPTVNPTPWVAGAIILLLAVVVPRMTAKIPTTRRAR
jgi:hypothetical protein